jgi:integrase
MGREVNRLSARRVETLKDPGRHADGSGLYLSISANGGRRWVFFYRWRGKQTEMGLGSARDVSLARARALAADARKLIADGINPLDAKRQAAVEQTTKRLPTFGECADELLDAMGPSWRNDKHRAQWETSLGRRDAARGAGAHAKPLRPKPVTEITTEDVLSVLRPIWQTKPETASRLRGRIEAVLDAARAQGHRSGENPARWRGHLDKLLPRPKKLSRGHHAAMPFEDVPAFVQELRALQSVSALALEFLILTAARSGEVRGATWDEVDEQSALWTVPAARMKGHREHRVPLPDRCLEILAELRQARRGAFIFPGGKPDQPLSVMALEMQMRRLKWDEFTPHGFRSAFRDWAGECTHFPREVAEAALAHLVGDQTERAYRRGDALQKRRELMTEWANFLDGPREGNVVSLNAEAR